MKRQIRRCVFETNSSSMHSLVVMKNEEYYTTEEVKSSLWRNKDGYVDFRYDRMEFNRSPFEILFSFDSKIRYVLASLCEYKGDEVYDEVCQVVKSYIPDFKDFILNNTGYTEENILSNFLEREHISISEFIKNKKYIVVVDSDCSGIYSGLKDHGIINVGNIEKEYSSITEFLESVRDD